MLWVDGSSKDGRGNIQTIEVHLSPPLSLGYITRSLSNMTAPRRLSIFILYACKFKFEQTVHHLSSYGMLSSIISILMHLF